MSFIFPQALYLFILVPVYIFLYLYFEKKRKKDFIPFGNVEVLIEAISKTKKIDFLKHLLLILQSLLLSFLIFALSRPTSTLYMPTRDTKVMLLIDNSISMEANDIKPDRITAARETAKYFVKSLPTGIQIGLGFFSGSVKILVNPTTDKNRILSVLNKLNVKKLEPGTSIGDAIFAAIDAISIDDDFNSKPKNKNDRMIVLVTDGEANVGADPAFASAQAKVNDITIQAIGIGNPLGSIIRGGIFTRLDEFTLQEITSLTGGNYFNAQNIRDLNLIYKKIKKTIRLVPQETEVTFIPALFAFFILIILQLLKWSKFRFS
ncbi:MAG: hypothetical protein A3B68_04670 [Candidatus Melainabacteria bacterium RIFCSPHIGHO2_02_FULL_34_12]|nr:MAG: hypothetical protein A3B68_04670 [Candidatus Melainabacteria bacterium RIFCSPHIGHO2_02_FULL_34_12]